MSRVEAASHLPFGLAKDLNRHISRRKDTYLARFLPVRNTVIKVNQQIHSPIKLSVGEPSPLGVYAYQPDWHWSDSQDGHHPGITFECWPEHQRSALVARAFFADLEGRIYRDIDIKGVGNFGIDYFSGKEKLVFRQLARKGGRRSIWGLLDKDVALYDWQTSEQLLKAGIRTYRVMAIADLRELVIERKLVSVYRAQRENLVGGLRNFRPVAEIRAFGTQARIDDLKYSVFGNLLRRDAETLVAWELGLPQRLSHHEYLVWFAQTLARNAALLHQKGWAHQYLTPHNITLDCRIVDLDSVEKNASKKEIEGDIDDSREALFALQQLSATLKGVRLGKYYKQIFEKTYQQTLNSSS